MRALALLPCVLSPACVDEPPEAVPMVGGVAACPGAAARDAASGEMIARVDEVAFAPWRGEILAEERADGRYEVHTIACVLDEEGAVVATWNVGWFVPDLVTAPLQIVGSTDPTRNGFGGTYGRLADGDRDTFGLGGGARGYATVHAFDPAGVLDVTMNARGVPTADAEGGELGQLEAALRWRW